MRGNERPAQPWAISPATPALQPRHTRARRGYLAEPGAQPARSTTQLAQIDLDAACAGQLLGEFGGRRERAYGV